MSQSGGNHQRLPRLPLALTGIVLLGLLTWLVQSTKRDASRPGAVSVPKNGSEVLPSKSDRKNRAATEGLERVAQGKRSTDRSNSEVGEDGPQFPLVDQILADNALTDEQAAAGLMEIANNKSLSVLEREEALAHGLNLDFPRFVEMVSDTQLPQPMAQKLFDEMLNHNEYRALQVRASMLLMDHEDATMRDEAAQQLAFYIGLEESSDKPEQLKQEARAFLEDLAKRPPPEPQPVDPDADIPETKPINPLVSEEEDDEGSDDEPVADKP